jgi:hypothetical protein
MDVLLFSTLQSRMLLTVSAYCKMAEKTPRKRSPSTITKQNKVRRVGLLSIILPLSTLCGPSNVELLADPDV